MESRANPPYPPLLKGEPESGKSIIPVVEIHRIVLSLAKGDSNETMPKSVSREFIVLSSLRYLRGTQK